ncbi:hypothetical protein K1719_045230 [Acacia pycnantha]|nr:hypothetical protein K1719_045230 [Acacia pycnantha]
MATKEDRLRRMTATTTICPLFEKSEAASFSGQLSFFFCCFRRHRLVGMPEPPSSSLSSSAHTNLDSFNSVLQCSVCVATHDSVGRVISHLNKGIVEERYTD